MLVMKKYLITLFILVLLGSSTAFAQTVDSSKLNTLEKRMERQERKEKRLEKKGERYEKKMKKQERKVERAAKKKEKEERAIRKEQKRQAKKKTTTNQ